MVETNKLEAMVEFDYVAQEPDELTIHKGDIIKDIKTAPGGWWEGSLGDKRGMFPDNFVKLLVDTTKHNASPPVTLRTSSGRRCKVLFSYQPVNEDELPLEINDVIDVIGEVEEGWWKGKLRDAVGVFPSNFVSEISDCPADSSSSQASNSSYKRNSRVMCESDSHSTLSPDSSHSETGKTGEDNDAPVLPPKPVKEICRVIFPYEAANKDELSLKEGEIIMIVSKEVADKGWWKGELRGRVGVFPDNFVEIIQEEVSKKPERPPSKSQLSTTNRIRDTITKPSAPSTCKSEPADVVASRKSQDEKPQFPPVPGKKPQLPPPIKKPQRIPGSSQGGTKHQDQEQTLLDVVDGVGSSRIAQSNYGVPKGNREEVPEFDNVERSAMLNHPTAGRVKAPRRRLPTNVHSRDSETPVGLMNGSALGTNQEEDLIMKNNGLQSRLWENKSKAPWMEELKMNQAKKQTSGPLKSPSSINNVHSGSISDQAVLPETIPNPSTARHSISGEINIPSVLDITPKPVSSGGNKLKKDVSSERQQVSHVNETSGGAFTKSHSMSSSIVLGSEDISDMNQNHQNLKSSIKPTSHQSVTSSSNIPVKADGAVGDSNVSPALSHSQGTTIPSIQYLELMDKIVKLEKSLEQQRATFTQAIKEVTEKLNEERNRRTHLEQELDKLTNLVTQV